MALRTPKNPANSRFELRGEAAGGQPEIERASTEVLDLSLVEDAAGHGHGRFAGDKFAAPRRLGAIILRHQVRGSVRGGDLPRSLMAQRNSLYQSMVRASPSSRSNSGPQPSMRRALRRAQVLVTNLVGRFVAHVGLEAGSHDAGRILLTRSSTVTWISLEKLNAWPRRSRDSPASFSASSM